MIYASFSNLMPLLYYNKCFLKKAYGRAVDESGSDRKKEMPVHGWGIASPFLKTYLSAGCE
jgi:hypothetical protein